MPWGGGEGRELPPFSRHLTRSSERDGVCGTYRGGLVASHPSTEPINWVFSCQRLLTKTLCGFTYFHLEAASRHFSSRMPTDSIGQSETASSCTAPYGKIYSLRGCGYWLVPEISNYRPTDKTALSLITTQVDGARSY